MSSSLVIAAVTLLAYLIGGLPFGYWFVRFSSGKDIRTMGSGNIGATNVHRTSGGKAGVIVLLLDIFKGFVAVLLAAYLTHNDSVGVALSVVAVLLGHCYPVFLRFKGGKAVACYVGAFLYLAPLAILATLVVFLAAFASFGKHVSLGSIIGAVFFPFVFWLIYTPSQPILLAAIASSLLIIFRHKANIARLRRGEESVFSLKGGKAVKNP